MSEMLLGLRYDPLPFQEPDVRGVAKHVIEDLDPFADYEDVNDESSETSCFEAGSAPAVPLPNVDKVLQRATSISPPPSPSKLKKSGSSSHVIELQELANDERLEGLPDHGVKPFSSMDYCDMLFQKDSMREMLYETWAKTTTWPEFIDPTQLAMPQSIKTFATRIPDNIDRFFHNYVVVSLFIVAFTIAMRPLAFVSYVALFVSYAYFFMYHERESVVIWRLVIHEHGKSAIWLLFSVFLLTYTSSGYVALTLFSACFLLVLVHAGFRRLPEEPEICDMLSPRAPLGRSPRLQTESDMGDESLV
ncbi:PRA1 family protein D [Porphyridium purpureum]|uniref:PRA1 family protein D n=1 Tax=Porphyridium purpureum TaxID=35688 RepID=A0A5J4YSS7_PORPP|nr:PRA1 family protein D [Porphyridium purpureum]|eukprot:POR0347..scf227_4